MRFDWPTAADIPALRSLWLEAFDDPDAVFESFLRTAYDPSRCRCAFDGDTLAAALYIFDCEYAGQKIAYLYSVATFESHRGQGICRALMADTHRMLAERGYAAVILVPGEDSLFTFYARMGYRTSCHIREFSADAAAEPIRMRAVTTAEYAELRRKFLPADGVIQEGANLAFLIEDTNLYAGDAFLLAARREGDTLMAAELLGDARCAPGILSALGCRRGRFRTPGDACPFAMIFPLREDFSPPGYFGLAMDW